jgi:spore coat polysaccharide biosynthesis predicted glycosyltransferase SpsG
VQVIDPHPGPLPVQGEGESGAAAFGVVELDWIADPPGLRATLERLAAQVVVVDSYAATAEFLAGLATPARLVVAIDDVADRPLPVDVVVNGGIAAETLPYDRAGGVLLLLGARYALVDPLFATPLIRPGRTRIERVLVSLGGGRQTETVKAALGAIDAALDGVQIDLVVGPFGPEATGLDTANGRRENRLVIHRDPVDRRDLMAVADLAIAGAGVTLYELSATATPTVVIEMAGNQAPNAAGFARAGAALPAGRADQAGLAGELAQALRRLSADAGLRRELGARARELVDGAGAFRVAREVASAGEGGRRLARAGRP